ncbi:mitochondrial carrier [Annulohypoxylon truncatum]|uniref:mitochondrial carrier n=1 Tax=Annulohypoxylon truncatum TaxID=327061 RepID=UPI0020079E95|nr:mitochondrial carrier [Annulohypoxylon truncatum]KAI1209731.1 mitochondrial carrier [Annulohypoxylon truncatum]
MSMMASNHTFGGHNHDRLGDGEDAFVGQTMVSSQDDGSDGVDISVGQKMISAISGSLLTSLLVTPLDVVRVRLQSQGSSQPVTEFQKLAISSPSAFRPSNLGVTACCREVFFMNNNAEVCVAGGPIEGLATSECAVEEVQKRTFNSTFDGMKKIARHEGFTTLWRGLSPTLVMAVPGNIIYFTGYEWLRFNKASPVNKLTKDDYAPLIAGSFARTIAAAVVGPIELFRTRLQASPGSTATGHLANTFKGIRKMVNENGYRSLWRGLTLTLWRDVPFSGMYWFGYETIRGKLTDIREERQGRSLTRDDHGSKTGARKRSQSREGRTATFMDAFTAGALSGAAASLATMPFDVGKTRRQVFHDATNKALPVTEKGLAPETQPMLKFLWHIYSTEGLAGLWKGWLPRTLKVAPSCAIMISSYEVGKRVFRSMNEKKALKQQQGEAGEP